MIMASRIVYGMSKEGIVPSGFGRVLKGRRTPITAIVFTTVLGLILVSTGDLSELADTTVLLASCRLHDGQRLRARAPPRAGRPRPLPSTHHCPDPGGDRVGRADHRQRRRDIRPGGLLLLLGVILWIGAYASGHRTAAS